MKIDIGCGGKKKGGFIGLDQYLMPGVDHVLDIGTERWPGQPAHQFMRSAAQCGSRSLHGAGM